MGGSTQASTSSDERRWLKVLGTLNESQARLFVAEKALSLGRGGVSRLSRLTQMSRPTIMKGIGELQGPAKALHREGGRIRSAGGGRKKREDVDPEILKEL